MKPDWMEILLRAVQDTTDVLGNLVREESVQPPVSRLLRPGLVEEAGASQAPREMPRSREWSEAVAGFPSLEGQMGKADAQSEAIRRTFLELTAAPPALPQEELEGAMPPWKGASFKRFAFGGGDLARTGVTPAEIAGFPESRRPKAHPRVAANGSVETHYIAANALQAILKLVDESVARQLGGFGAH